MPFPRKRWPTAKGEEDVNAQRLGSSAGFWLSALLVVPALACLEFLRRVAADRCRQLDSPPPSRAVGFQIWRLLRSDGMYRLAFAAMLTQTAVLALYAQCTELKPLGVIECSV